MLASLAVACRTANSERPERPERPQPSQGDRYLIEGDELNAPTATNLYDVIRLRRPAWLSRPSRAGSSDAIIVYFDDRPIGTLNVLREMPIRVAASLRFLSETEAQLRFGPKQGSRVAIVVESAKPD